MKKVNDWVIWLSITLVCAAGLFGATRLWPGVESHAGFSWICLVFFALTSLLGILWGQVSAANKPGRVFISFAMLYSLGKMALSMLVLVFYNKSTPPAGKEYIWPFLTFFVVYTVFETLTLMRIAKRQ